MKRIRLFTILAVCAAMLSGCSETEQQKEVEEVLRDTVVMGWGLDYGATTKVARMDVFLIFVGRK